MDPIKLIVAALASGTLVKATKNRAIEEIYTRLKTLLRKKFTGNPDAMFVLDKFEEKPEIWEAPLKDELIQTRALEDKEIIETANTLLSLQRSQQQADYERIASEAANQRRQLQHIYEQLQRQSADWLRFSLIAAVLGIMCITIGVFAILTEKFPIGLLIVVLSLIPEATAALFSLRARETKKRADVINEQLVQSERIYQAIELALMSDDETRQRLQRVIVERLLNLAAGGQETPIPDPTQLLST